MPTIGTLTGSLEAERSSEIESLIGDGGRETSG